MPPVYTYDHIHLRTTNPQATIEYYQKMFDATPLSGRNGEIFNVKELHLTAQ